MGTYKPELKSECIRLRTEENKSFRDIALITGASKGSLSLWLKEYPLPEEVLKEKLKANSPYWRGYSNPKKDRGEESEIHSVVRMHNLNGVQVAKVAEAAVMLRMLAQGFNVFGSVFDGDKADWVVEIPQTGKIVKIQVKTTRRGNTGLSNVILRHGHNTKIGARRYEDGDFDFLVGYDLFTDVAYVWGCAEVAHLKAGVTINPDAKEKWYKLIGV